MRSIHHFNRRDLSIMSLFTEIRNRWTTPNRPDKLTILRNDHLGDLILTLPLVKQSLDWLGDGNVSVVVGEPYPPLLERTPLSPRVFVDSGGGFRALADVLGETGADTLITAASKTRNALASQWSGISQRLGFGYKLNAICYTHPLFIHRKDPAIHEAEFCLEYLRMLPGAPDRRPRLPEYQSTDEDRRKAREVLENKELTDTPYFVVHPGHSESAEHFSPEQYRSLLEKLEDDHQILITGKGSKELQLIDQLQRRLSNVRAIERDLSLPVFARIIEASDLYVGGSSGPLHLASLTRTPRVGLYSNDPRFQPAKWKPLGDDQLILTPPEGTNVKDFDVKTIVKQIEAFLRG